MQVQFIDTLVPVNALLPKTRLYFLTFSIRVVFACLQTGSSSWRTEARYPPIQHDALFGRGVLSYPVQPKERCLHWLLWDQSEAMSKMMYYHRCFYELSKSPPLYIYLSATVLVHVHAYINSIYLYLMYLLTCIH